MAADQGLALAQYDLGQRCDLGVGVPQDRIEALKWLMLAADQGQPDAAARRDTLKKTMTRKEISKTTRLVEVSPAAGRAIVERPYQVFQTKVPIPSYLHQIAPTQPLTIPN